MREVILTIIGSVLLTGAVIAWSLWNPVQAQGSPKHEPFSVYPYGNTCVFVIQSDQDRNSPVGITAVPMDYVGNFCLPQ